MAMVWADASRQTPVVSMSVAITDRPTD